MSSVIELRDDDIWYSTRSCCIECIDVTVPPVFGLTKSIVCPGEFLTIDVKWAMNASTSGGDPRLLSWCVTSSALVHSSLSHFVYSPFSSLCCATSYTLVEPNNGSALTKQHQRRLVDVSPAIAQYTLRSFNLSANNHPIPRRDWIISRTQSFWRAIT